MGRIQSSVGLVTGTDIAGTVDQLMAINAQPRNRLASRNNTLQREQQSIAELTASVIGVQLSGNRLSLSSTFRSKEATSSDSDSISALAGTSSEPASYVVQTLQTASTASYQSRRRFDSDSEALGFTGSLSLSPSGDLDQSIPLSDLNNGRGVDAGRIRITDRSGDSAIVDLTQAQTIDEVLVAINDADIGISATTAGGRIQLSDLTGSSDSNLIVEQLGNDETAADLGLWGIDQASDVATGLDLTFDVTTSTQLSELRQGSGVRLASGNDLSISLADGTQFDIDFGDQSGSDIQDVLDSINGLDPAKLSATFTNGQIEVTDLTTGSESFTIADSTDSFAASDLGISGTATNDTITSSFEVQVLRGTSLADLNGGSGITGLTDLDITTSDGSTASIDLSGAETTSEILDAINDSGLDVIARLNDAGTGLRIRDVSGGTSNFVISSADDTADQLGIAADTSSDIVSGQRLNRQTLNSDTLLSSLNRGQGIDKGSFTITDSDGTAGTVNINSSSISTVGDLVDAINDLGTDVTASLGENGDGITLVDNASGSGTLSVTEFGSDNTARDLGLLGEATTQTINGSSESAIVGSQSDEIEIDSTDSLTSIADKINATDRYATASVQRNDDGSFSLRIQSTQGGAGGQFGITTSGFELSLDNVAEAQDAVISVSVDGGDQRILTSSDGVFDLSGTASADNGVSASTKLTSFASGTEKGSIKLTDSAGVASAINLTTENISTVGQLVTAINDLGIGVTASINDEGTGIQLIDTAGGDAKLKVEDVGNGIAAAQLGIAGEASSETIAGEAVSALIGLGEVSQSSSSTSGLSLTVKQLSDNPITINVAENFDSVISAATTFVDQYNLLVDKLDSLTFFNADTQEVGLLFGSSEASRIRNGYSRLLSGAIAGAGNINNLGQVGIRFNDQGKLQLDQSKLSDALEDSRGDVEAFFTTEDNGVVARLDDLADRIAGADTGLLLNRTEILATQVQRNNIRLETFDERLEQQRERLLLQFFETEEAISKIQGNSSAIDQIERITIPT